VGDDAGHGYNCKQQETDPFHIVLLLNIAFEALCRLRITETGFRIDDESRSEERLIGLTFLGMP
jgi:hypothetical protein